ncbi:MAG: ABC transporter ATP-binding protein [Rhodospirillaceae bacterium]|jgi:oligopeptide/dipeptide ABC transporter ATP-binding protein|nr:ABC transporter ATP-binding protein [Rhodospirillaceae bacterium]MBT6138020.1 ABC transporter ATP-binding protein [Rhodospirillaceae bacterium]
MTAEQTSPVLDVRGLVKHFPTGKRDQVVHAVNGVNFSIRPGETLGMVGESGSGKSTIGRTVLRLTEPTAGKIAFQGQEIAEMPMAACRPLRADMQMVFQDPWSALNPRMKVRDLIAEPLLLHTKMTRGERRDRTDELAGRVHLSTDFLTRYPSDLSGGQLQRVCIARAIATNPKLIILDEPTSSLDISVRAGILELLAEIKQQTEAAVLFISHDLGTVRLISDRIVVLYLGKIVEYADADAVFEDAAHPYTQSLMSAHLPANPKAEIRRHVLEGEVPSPIDMPSGCAFHTRCPVAIEDCRRTEPQLEAAGNNTHQAACLRILDGKNRID